ncbi:MAG: D-hydantoinase [Anaerolineae bacterium]|nr:D-hydantoinase [Anaerolineae bacterium]
MSVDLLITNGLVVAEGKITRADLGIRGEKIVARAPRLTLDAARVIDADGKYIFPGLIDAHVHPIYSDDKYDTSIGAAFGGVTTLIHYAYVKPGEKIIPTCESFRDDGLQNSMLDFGIHAGLFDVANQIGDVPAAFALGIASFKVFMTYAKLKWMTDDYWMAALMDVVAQQRGLVNVHCENGVVTDYLEDKYNRAGLDSKKMFTAMRPARLEAEATHRAISIAQVMGCAVYIVHNSAAENLEPLRRAKQNGWRVVGETCPQYLTLTDEVTQALGAPAKIGPPLRYAHDNAAMWQGLREGILTTIGSDHAPKVKKSDDNFFDAAYGAPQIETMLPMCYHVGVNQGNLTLPTLIAAMSETPAKTFGLYPRKGALQVDSDADLVIFDPTKTWTISQANQHSKAGFTLYADKTVTGAVELTMQRGCILVENGELRGARGGAQFLKTDTSHFYK